MFIKFKPTPTKRFYSLISMGITIFVFMTLFMGVAPVTAASAADFQPGRIMDDVVMGNSNTMSESAIQSFMNSRLSSCDTNGEKSHTYRYRSSDGRVNNSNDAWVTTTRATYGQRVYNWRIKNGLSDLGSRAPYTCLKSYSQNGKTSARIIWETAQTHSINPQSLLVLLQKEQALLSDDWPWGVQYRSATGYGCPDTAACDSEYYGFTNQINLASNFFRKIIDNDPNFYIQYRVGNNTIKWHPDSSCGSSTVNIENRTTAALYQYTPYRPNSAAMNNIDGEGNGCSSYGNRNFWRDFTDWFGPTVRDRSVWIFQCEDNNKYLVEDGVLLKRRLTPAALTAWNLGSYDFDEFNAFCNYNTFSVDLDRIMRSRNTGKPYLIDDGNAYYIDSQTTANAWGIGSGNLNSEVYPQFNPETIKEFHIFNNLPRLARSKNTGNTYLVSDGGFYSIAGAVNGVDSDSLKLIQGYNEVPVGVFTYSLITTQLVDRLSSSPALDYSFKIGTDTYLLNHGEIRKIDPAVYPKWQGLLTGPTYNADVLDIFDRQNTLAHGWEREDYYYRAVDGEKIEASTNEDIARYWGLRNAPTITRLLTKKITDQNPFDEIFGISSTENIRLIKCDTNSDDVFEHYMVERYNRNKRLLSETAITNWQFDGLYFNPNDAGCAYNTYGLALDQKIRSRNSGRVYKVEAGVAKRVVDDGNIYPKLDGKSIHFLSIQ